MARHDQKFETPAWTCLRCREFECKDCVDRVRARVSKGTVSRLCTCKHPYEAEQEIAEVRAELS